MKAFPDNNFCLNVCRFGGNIDLVLLGSFFIIGLCFLGRNLDFISVFGSY